MWGDLLKGLVLGIIVGIVLVVFALYGLIPLPFEICSLC